MKVSELYADAVYEKPNAFDFSKGYGVTWKIPFSYDALDEYCPMTNYAYLLPEEFEKDMKGRSLRKIVDDCDSITLVYLICLGRYALALRGCGMDHSWEICEAYVNFGYLPPIHFCDLPELAGMKGDKKTERVMDACKKSLEICISYNSCLKERLGSMQNNLKGVTT